MIRFGDITIDAKTLTITHGGIIKQWPRHGGGHRHHNCQFKVIRHLLLTTGMTRQQLFDAVYSGDPEGGPLQGQSAISVILAQIAPVLAHLGLVLKTSRHISRTIYRIVSPHA